MSKLGKILVCVNLAMSLVFAAGAAMLFLNRVDWTAQKGKDLAPPGALVPLIDEYKSLGENGIRPADARLRANARFLNDNEAWRPYEREWYAQQLQILKDGATEDKPARQVLRGPDGSVALGDYRKKGDDILKMGPLPIKVKSAAFYDRETKNIIDKIGKEMVTLEKEAKRDESYTNKIIGPNETVKTKGLNARLKEEKGKYDRVVEEYKAVRPLWLNARVEQSQLDEVYQRLDERVKELTTYKPVDRP